ncbi:hypothetical protein CGRA01v4_01505 [Colletotrichum graminicola]|nr:hypothetical protein CGRA01v4_01505 [Colletotrichum graminicola]
MNCAITSAQALSELPRFARPKRLRATRTTVSPADWRFLKGRRKRKPQRHYYSIGRVIDTTRIRWGYGDISPGNPLPKPARGVRRDYLAVVVISCNACI